MIFSDLFPLRWFVFRNGFVFYLYTLFIFVHLCYLRCTRVERKSLYDNTYFLTDFGPLNSSALRFLLDPVPVTALEPGPQF